MHLPFLHLVIIMLLIPWPFSSVLPCAPVGVLVPGMRLAPGKTLTSDQGSFALDFFTPSNSTKNTYVGIWFNDIRLRTVVWVANRDNPITDASSAVLTMTGNSSLVLSETNGHHILWMARTITGGNSSAKLLNNGNLVVQSSDGAMLWQSFKNPSDTVLPGMPMRTTHKTHPPWRIISWKGPEDPSKGRFSGGNDLGTPLQFFVWNGSVPYFRAAVWNGYVSSNVGLQAVSPLMYLTIYMGTDGETYSTFGLSDGSSRIIYKVDYSGKTTLWRWNTSLTDWTHIAPWPAYRCNLYGYCGAYGYCDNTQEIPTCKRLDGFDPSNKTEWVRGNFSHGCQRKEELQCGGEDSFLTLPAMKAPEKFVHLWNKSYDDCKVECSKNCSCVAYAYANLSTSNIDGDATRCLLWTGELIDVEKGGAVGNENLYLRLAAFSRKGRKGIVIKVIPAILASLLLILLLACLVWLRKFKGKHDKNGRPKRMLMGDLRISDGLGEETHELPFISFEEIVAATNNFSMSNLLGECGFGKVYKGDEKLLIYEYLPNRSLDTFLFNSEKKSMLHWPTRFNIIKGVARGLLYIHQDSRLMIILRDLKRSNILLDGDMNPKISDFGMARIFGGDEQQANTNRVVRTYGYMSPEYAMEGLFSVKSDVYSFGVLLLETVSGLRISSTQNIKEFPNLIIYAWSLWREGLAMDLVDPCVSESCSSEEALCCIHVGLLCVQDDPDARPLMSTVVSTLESRSTPLATPYKPLYFSQRNKVAKRAAHGQDSVDMEALTVIEGR
ncbi:G-type lectin S-receptor-like serine/threonine-protein kinase B120 isoform X2 [Triticum dicoccoides]|uniref:G-type lectin S-receptor-like serine/threonine-protein kinase B120 isoform X2 n=1 Tax=Triticum dicoccoides TaxID=85692 RepID=UPI00188F711B|nr:G-type lectin S-receptor-like serine/threonine-protein kinase B120 isoform X2 [Triticum dicoccoides]